MHFQDWSLEWSSAANAAVWDRLPTFKFRQGCLGDTWVIAFSQAINISFLCLFALFYISSYGSKSGAEGDAATKKKKDK